MRQVHKIKPKNGLNLRFPGIKRFLNPEGEFIEWSSFWERRLQQGDVEICSTMEEEKEFIENHGKEVDDSKKKKKTNSSEKGVEL